MFGIGFGITKNKYTGTGGSPVPLVNYYIDSVGGSDANDGLSEANAFQTVSAIPMDHNIVLNFARGSYFREQLLGNIGTSDGVTVNAYGTGAKPVFDAADIAGPTWVIDGTFTNVYTQTLNYSPDNADLYLSMWEDGARLLWVDTMAECNSTPGSWTIDGVVDGLSNASGSSAFSIHPYGSTNPNSDSKVYEYSSRLYGMACGWDWTVNNVRTKRNMHNNGSFVLGRGGIANDCIFEDGVKHNAIAEMNTIFNDCIAWKCDFPSRTQGTGMVSFEVNAAGGVSTYNRCIVLYEDDKLQYAVDNGTAIVGIYAHSSGVEGGNWDVINTNDCAFKGTSNAVSCADTNQFNSTRDFVDGGQSGILMGGFINNIIDPYIRERTDMSISMSRAMEASIDSLTTINGARVYTTRGGTGHVYASGNISITGSVFYRDEAPSFSNANLLYLNGTTMTIRQNILFGDRTGGSETFGYFFPSDPSMNTIDSNIMSTNPLTEMKVIVEGVEYWFEDFIVEYPTLDANSSEANPMLVDPANGNFNVDPASPAIALGAGLARPNIVYTEIPSHAEVEAM